MKKILFILGLFALVSVNKVAAQAPSCNNDAAVNNNIQHYLNQGYTEIDRQFFFVNYLLPPTPPYLYGTLAVTLVGPYCGPACTPIILNLSYDVTVKNNNGLCIWSMPGGNN